MRRVHLQPRRGAQQMSGVSSVLSLENPGACHYCDSVNTRAILLPWKKCEGWWTCAACMDKAVAQMHEVMNRRRIVGTNVLPGWFRDRNTFAVQRSSGAVTAMSIVDFACEFSKNEHNGESTEGRVQLSGGQIFIDMFYEDDSAEGGRQFKFKQVMLQNLYENNPELATAGAFVLALPRWVDATAGAEWVAAAERAVLAGKKKIELATEPDADETTDVDEPEVETTIGAGPIAVPAAAAAAPAAEAAPALVIDLPDTETAEEPTAEEPTAEEPAAEEPAAKTTLAADKTPGLKLTAYADNDEYPLPPTNPTFAFY